MVHLFAPPSVRRFSPRRVVSGPGMRHVGLEYDLVAALRPSLVVDLGAGDGASFFAYCQSMLEHDVDGLCYAFDTWAESQEANDVASFESVSAHGRSSYAGFSYFVRLDPAGARRHFDAASIDLLRVDGTRPGFVDGDAAEDWLSAVKPGGVIAWHGADIEPSGWSRIASRCNHFVFPEGRHGLGLARKDGLEPAPGLLELLFVDGEGQELIPFYTHVYEHLELARLVALALGKR